MLLGKKIYSNNCASCHASEIGPNLSYHTLELSEIIFHVKYRAYGMPSFQDKLSKKEIEDVSQYVYELRW